MSYNYIKKIGEILMKLKTKKNTDKLSIREDFRAYKQIYLLLLPAILFVFVFCYMPIPGLMISFMDYDFLLGFKSPWVGFANFKEIFTLPDFTASILNTIKLSVLNMTIVFIIPIIFALLLNELRNMIFKRVVQTISYLPHFLSWASVLGISYTLFSKYGAVNSLISNFNPEYKRVMWLTIQDYFVPNVVMLTIWKNMGWDTIVYLAALSGIDQGMYEAASIDGAGRFRKCWSITLPSLVPTITILFILATGRMFNDNFELIYGLQNTFIDFDVISTLTYKFGIKNGEYSIATALSMFQGVVNLGLIVITNYLSRKFNETSLW